MPLHYWKNPRVAWKSFHNHWIIRLVEQLNRTLPPDFNARSAELTIGIEPDVLVADAAAPIGTPPAAAALAEATLVATLPPLEEIPFVGVYSDYDASRLVAAIEIASPSNKESRRGVEDFVSKASLLLHEGVHLMVVDVISRPGRPIRKPLLEWLGIEAEVPGERLWISSFCARPQEDPYPRVTIREWAHSLSVGDVLPTLPLFLVADELWVMVDLEAAYQETILAGRFHPD